MPQLTLKLLNGNLFTTEWNVHDEDSNRLRCMFELDSSLQKLIDEIAQQTDSIDSQIHVLSRDGKTVETSLVYGYPNTHEFKENIISSPNITTVMKEYEMYGDPQILLVWIEPILDIPHVSRVWLDRIYDHHSYDSYPDRCIVWFNLLKPLAFEVFYWDAPTHQILHHFNVLNLEFNEDRVVMTSLARERLHRLRKKIEQIKTS